MTPSWQPGLITYRIDEATNRLWIRVPSQPIELLITSHLRTGMGSSGLTFDRGMQGKTDRIRIERDGASVRVTKINKKWTAIGAPAAEKAGAHSFVRSVLWTGLVEDGPLGAMTDLTTLVFRDHLEIADDLAKAGEGELSLDLSRSWFDPADSSNFPTHTEISGTITFAVANPGPKLRQVAPHAGTLSFDLRLTLIALPVGFEPRPFDPATGGYGKGFDNLAADPSDATTVLYQPRFRVTPDRPIVFNVDPAIPEPFLAAVLEGGNWWSAAFERAGIPGGFRVQVLPDDVDPFAAGTNMVWWVHRTGRGWSRGAASVDVRTGEILHANVRLGSQRLHQLQALFEALLSPYGRDDESQRLATIRTTIEARIRHLAAHEIGHALGFVHNYASTAHSSPSVMDYPHPRLSVSDGIDLSDAYSDGLGPWDFDLVRQAYGADPGPASELPFITDLDGHGPDASWPDGVPWTFGGDAFSSLQQILAVREVALADFSLGAIKPGRQLGELEGRFFLAYLSHRYQTQGVARLLGGAGYNYGLAGTATPGARPVDGALQQQALDRLSTLLAPEIVQVPRHVQALMTPPSIRYTRSPDAPEPAAGPIFDTVRAVEVAAGLIFEPALSAGRLNRLWEQHASALGTPSIADLIATLGRAALLPAGGDQVTRTGLAWAFGRHLAATWSEDRIQPWVHTEISDAIRVVGAEAIEVGGPATAVTRELLRLVDGQPWRYGTAVPAPVGIPL